MTNESGMILSIPQLRLCSEALGGRLWDDLPLIDTGEPAQQRIINAFMKLIQAGYFLPDGDGFAPAENLANVIIHIVYADRSFRLWEENQVVAFLYEKAGNLVTICPDSGNLDYCRVHNYADMTAEAWKELLQTPEKLILEQIFHGGTACEPETLALFFGQTKDTEETQ